MEPERHIEKLLRSLARFRRSQAGDPAKGADPFALHPATRRLLQGEVARRAPKPGAGAARAPWFWGFHPLLAGALVMAVLCTLAAALLPTLSKAKYKAQSVAAMSQLRQIGIAAQLTAVDNAGKLPPTLDELTNIIPDRKLLVDPQSGQPFTYVGSGKYLASLPSNAVIAYAPEQKRRRAVLLADGSVRSYSATDFSVLTNATTGDLAVNNKMPAGSFDLAGVDAPAAAPAPAQRDMDKALSVAAKSDQSVAVKDEPANHQLNPVLNGLPQSATAGLDSSLQLGQNQSTQMFVAVDRLENSSLANNNNGQFYRNQANARRQAPLLGKFQWQQNGNAVRVVDTDGSVYEGSLTENAANAVITVALPQAGTLAANNRTANTQNAPGQSGLSFQVRGRSQTLKQNIIFAGNFIPLPDTSNSAQANGTALAANNASQVVAVSNNAAVVNGQITTTAGIASQLAGGAMGGNNRNSTLQNAAVNNQAAANSTVNQLNWVKAHIIGTVQLENTNQFDIDAVPSAQ